MSEVFVLVVGFKNTSLLFVVDPEFGVLVLSTAKGTKGTPRSPYMSLRSLIENNEKLRR